MFDEQSVFIDWEKYPEAPLCGDCGKKMSQVTRLSKKQKEIIHDQKFLKSTGATLLE